MKLYNRSELKGLKECPTCSKGFKSALSMNKHYGMAHEYRSSRYGENN